MIYKIMNEAIVFPPNMSFDCQDLIRKMLKANEKERITLSQIRTHPWTLAGYGIPLPSMLPAVNPINEINEDIMKLMSLIGVPNTPRTRREILENVHSPLTHTYVNIVKQRAKAKQNPSLNPSPRERTPSVDELLVTENEEQTRPNPLQNGEAAVLSTQNKEMWQRHRASSFDTKKQPSAKIRLQLPLTTLPSEDDSQLVGLASKDANQNHKKCDPASFNAQGPLKSPRVLDLVSKKEKHPHHRAPYRMGISAKAKKRLSEKPRNHEKTNLSEVSNFVALYDKNSTKKDAKKHVNFAITEKESSTSNRNGAEVTSKECPIVMPLVHKPNNKKTKRHSEKVTKIDTPTKEFKSTTTSSASMTDLIAKVTKVLKKEEIKTEQNGLTFKCATPSINFEIELVTISKLPNMRGIKFKHINGRETEYKEVVDVLTAKLKLCRQG
jgi:hypothetical protein